MKMKVKVKTLSGNMLVYECMPTETVLSLKYQVFQTTGIPIFLQRFIFRTKELNNNENLNRYEIQNESIIHLVFNVNEMHQYKNRNNSNYNNTDPNNIQNEDNSKKRRGTYTKVACTNCRKAHASCDNSRPCKRCRDQGKSDSCVDAPRKRKKKNSSNNDGPPNISDEKSVNIPPIIKKEPIPPPKNKNFPNPQYNPNFPVYNNNNTNSQKTQNFSKLEYGSEYNDDLEEDDLYFDDDEDDLIFNSPSNSLRNDELGSSWKSNFLIDDMNDLYDDDTYPNVIGSPPLINNPLTNATKNPGNVNMNMNISAPPNISSQSQSSKKKNVSMNQNSSNSVNVDPRFFKVLEGGNPFSSLDEFLNSMVSTVIQQAKEIQELKMNLNSVQRRLAYAEGSQNFQAKNSNSLREYDYGF